MVSVRSTLLPHSGHLDVLGSLIHLKCTSATLRQSLPRVKVLLESLIASINMDFNQSLPSMNMYRSMASRSMSSVVDDCYKGYQHVCFENEFKNKNSNLRTTHIDEE